MLSKHQFSILVLLGTKVKKDFANSVRQRCGLMMECIDNYDYTVNGRIWLLWKQEEVTVNLLHSIA